MVLQHSECRLVDAIGNRLSLVIARGIPPIVILGSALRFASLRPWMTKFASFGQSRTFATIYTAATLIRHGMDSRRRVASLLAPPWNDEVT
ncbi:hypothetical protein RFM68_22725 [Mesorhizobium sp. MSK_1335]|uniref:Uncharacterized protein n=1 Tax=Mesorhizobium montanum TaxID=3072323 RepID=A0ABU4ZQP3_9HYPH|nr:hypothetical protein [Mesorhizobium sp. MSK_1335]MDX8527320.1 hypothetical protein [Mesorhizobium sp. MSK_1335]